MLILDTRAASAASEFHPKVSYLNQVDSSTVLAAGNFCNGLRSMPVSHIPIVEYPQAYLLSYLKGDKLWQFDWPFMERAAEWENDWLPSVPRTQT